METLLLDELRDGPAHPFAAWPNKDIPKVVAGAYTVWRDELLVYAGMAGRSLTAESIARHLDDPTRVTGLLVPPQQSRLGPT
jgi:hypothetical protein